MRRRHLLLAPLAALRAEGSAIVRGRFSTPGVVTTSDGRKISLTGDDPTKLVLEDKRLNGLDFEAVGEMKNGVFVINPIHLRGIWVYRKGARLMVTYWCDICYIRTYSPGICWCCQEDTKFDPKDPNSKDPTP
jgi:hypothetical protein